MAEEGMDLSGKKTQKVAIFLGDEPGFSVYNFKSTLFTGRYTFPATIAQLLVNFY